MKGKKGYALITTVVVVSLLLILATSVLALSVSALKASKSVEKVSKIKLEAESAIEKGKLLLKNYILVNTNHTTNVVGVAAFDYLNFNPDDMNTAFPSIPSTGSRAGMDTDRDYHDGDMHVVISFGPDTIAGNVPFYDGSTGRTIKYIEIKATVTEGSATKVYSVILDKNSLTNVYFKQIFKTAMTTADDISNAAGATSSLYLDNGAKLDISGDLFFQGSNLSFFNSDPLHQLLLNEGKITTNTNNLATEIGINTDMTDSSGGTVDLFKNTTANVTVDGTVTLKTKWADTTPRYLKVLNILYPSVDNPNAGPVHDLGKNPTPSQAELESYIAFQKHIDPFTTTALAGNPTLITYKVKNNAPINFQNLISGATRDNPFISTNVYETIIKKLMDPTSYGYSKEDAISNYKKIYKLILVDGDLTIDDDSQENFINYLVYCTGTVNFLGDAKFYNSSLFAKRINFGYVPNYRGVIFKGVGTKAAGAYLGDKNNPLDSFSDVDKMIINDYLIKNLDGYADYIEYKVVQWK